MEHNPQNIRAIFLVVCRLLPPNHLIPTAKLLLFLYSRWDVVCLCVYGVCAEHWQNTKQHPFLIHAGDVLKFYIMIARRVRSEL